MLSLRDCGPSTRKGCPHRPPRTAGHSCRAQRARARASIAGGSREGRRRARGEAPLRRPGQPGCGGVWVPERDGQGKARPFSPQPLLASWLLSRLSLPLSGGSGSAPGGRRRALGRGSRRRSAGNGCRERGPALCWQRRAEPRQLPGRLPCLTSCFQQPQAGTRAPLGAVQPQHQAAPAPKRLQSK